MQKGMEVETIQVFVALQAPVQIYLTSLLVTKVENNPCNKVFPFLACIDEQRTQDGGASSMVKVVSHVLFSSVPEMH